MNNPLRTEQLVMKGLLRTPLFSYHKFGKIDAAALRKFADLPIIKESMLLASPSFHEELNKWRNGELTDKARIAAIEQTLYKYVARTTTRCTPFGVFGSVSYVEITSDIERNKGQLVLDQAISSRTRLDSYSTQLLIDYLHSNKELLLHLKYSANNSIYELGEFLRYFESKRGSYDTFFELSKASKNGYLEQVIAFCSSLKSIGEIKGACFDEENTDEEIVSFLYELIEAKILVSELEFKITTPNHIKELIGILDLRLADVKIDGALSVAISSIKMLIDTLDNESISINTKYEQVATVFKKLGIKVDLKDLIHVDSYRNVEGEITIKQPLIDELLAVKEILSKLGSPPKDPLKQFKIDFSRRYEDKRMDLLHVLDPEAGIGYRQRNEEGDELTLLTGIEIPRGREAENYSMTNIDVFLIQKLIETNNNGTTEIELSAEELQDFPSTINQAETMSAFFTLLSGNTKILLEGFSGPTGISFLNRYSYLDNRIHALNLLLANYEEACNSDKIVAEIIHLPETKSGNLLSSQPLRAYEIPCVTLSQKAIEHNIQLSDLQISLVNGEEIELYSKKHQKIVIPKLSNTLNHNRNSMNVYRFLADLQFQNSTAYIGFSWQGASLFFDFFPRVTYKKIIISPSYWRVSISELLENNPKTKFDEKLQQFQENRKISNQFYLSATVTDDHKLYLDISAAIGKRVFKSELSKLKKAVVTEVFLHDKTGFVDGLKEYYNNELILPIIKEPATPQLKVSTAYCVEKKMQWMFPPGTEWISFKIYLGHQTADELLSKLSVLSKTLKEETVISKWFFVRYADEDFHLRIRFLTTQSISFARVIREMNTLLNYYLENGMIHNVVIDTYKRELERYKFDCIESCESIFSVDSFSVAELIHDNDSEDRRWLYGVVGVAAYLNDFGFELTEKVELLEFISSQFFKEFNGNKKLKLELDKKYRSVRTAMIDSLGGDHSKEYCQLINIFQNRSRLNKTAVKSIMDKLKNSTSNSDLIDVVLSLVHLF
jgi:thiopeptide-type bacteriocin biosynthesis protein